MKKIIIGLFALSLFSACSVLKGKKESYKVLMETNYGNMTIQLYKDVPQHSANFLKLVKAGFYDSLLFHRVIPRFMIQGGDPHSKRSVASSTLGNGENGYLVPAEFKIDKYIHKYGALAAARTNNPEKKSSGCQFYIVQGKTYSDAEIDNFEKSKKIKYTKAQRELYKEVGGTPHLDNEYTVYGEVIDGLEVIRKISLVKCGRSNRPAKDVRIIRARVIK